MKTREAMASMTEEELRTLGSVGIGLEAANGRQEMAGAAGEE